MTCAHLRCEDDRCLYERVCDREGCGKPLGHVPWAVFQGSKTAQCCSQECAELVFQETYS